MRNLQFQLFLAILAVTSCALIAVGVFSMQTTASQFQLLEKSRPESGHISKAAARSLGLWYEKQGSWRNVDSQLRSISPNAILFSRQGTFLGAAFRGVTDATLDARDDSAIRLTLLRGSKLGHFLLNDSPGAPVTAGNGHVVAEMFAIPIPAESAEEPLQTLARQLWLAILCAIAAALVAAAIVARNILAPIYKLSDAANALHAGDLSQRVKANGPAEIKDLARHFNAMAAHLERSEMLRKQMIVDIAHELRTPLTNIRGTLEAIDDGHVPVTHTTLDSIAEEALLLARLVNDLQDMSLGDAGQFSFELAQISLPQCIRSAVTSLDATARQKQITVLLQVNEDATVHADEARIRQVAANILSNALRLSPDGSTIMITISKQGNFAKVAVHDEGPGLSQAALESAFERFYRADESRSRASGGAGLGLAIAKQLVEALGGTIGAENNASKGATFWFTLPLRQ